MLIKLVDCRFACLLLFFLIALHFSCDKHLLDPNSEFEIPDIENIIWTLAAAKESGEDVDISIYPPFHLIYDDVQFFGDDGCNWFGGQYEMRNGTIVPGKIAQTLRLCLRATFPIDHLAEPYRLQINQNRLRIIRDDNVYTYESIFTAPLDSQIVTPNWTLMNSNDPQFQEIEAQGLIPTLSLNDDRTFRIIWDCGPNNPFGCDSIAGLFGIGGSGKITFYQREGSYHGQGPGENFMQRILAASSFAVEPEESKGAKLLLTNPADGITFEFQSVTR